MQCPPSLKHQAATSQARLNSSLGSTPLVVGNLCIALLVPDLALELVDEGLHPLVVLPVLLLLEGQLLDPPLTSAQILLRIAVAPALSVQLRLQLPRIRVVWVMDESLPSYG